MQRPFRQISPIVIDWLDAEGGGPPSLVFENGYVAEPSLQGIIFRNAADGGLGGTA